MADKYDEALDAALAKWSTASTPARQQLAFRDGFHEGWQAALMVAYQISERRFEGADSGIGVAGLDQTYLRGVKASCVAIATDLQEHDCVRAPRDAALDRMAENARKLGLYKADEGTGAFGCGNGPFHLLEKAGRGCVAAARYETDTDGGGND